MSPELTGRPLPQTPTPRSPAPQRPVLQARDVSVQRGPSTVVKGVSLSAQAGQWLACCWSGERSWRQAGQLASTSELTPDR